MLSADSAPGPPGGPTPDNARLAALVAQCPIPALLIELPSGKILAGSPTADTLLSPEGNDIRGTTLEDFTVDAPSGALELLNEGRIRGYETVRWLKADGAAAPYRLWLQTTSATIPSPSAFVVLATEPMVSGGLLSLSSEDDWVVVGTAGATLLIDGISAETEAVLGIPASDLIGIPLLAMVRPASVGRLLSTLAETTASGRAATARVTLRTEGDRQLRCLLLLLPLEPAPRCTFAFVPFGWPTAALLDARGIGVLRQLVRAAASSEPVDPALLADHLVVGLSRLTARELDIVTRLVSGDRVPAIAASLYLGQSTVRNHLSSVFAKLRVGSQQQLLDLLRQPRTDRPDAGESASTDSDGRDDHPE